MSKMCLKSDVGIKCIESTTYTKDISDEIKNSLPDIIRAVVKETTETVTKTYAEAVNKEV